MKKNDQPSNTPDSQSVDAVRHIGPTLESESERVYVPKADRLSPQDQAAAEEDLTVRTLSDSGEAKPHLRESADSEPLKTRLPGDTSSDPHTDVETDLGREDKPRNAA